MGTGEGQGLPVGAWGLQWAGEDLGGRRRGTPGAARPQVFPEKQRPAQKAREDKAMRSHRENLAGHAGDSRVAGAGQSWSAEQLEKQEGRGRLE